MKAIAKCQCKWCTQGCAFSLNAISQLCEILAQADKLSETAVKSSSCMHLYTA